MTNDQISHALDVIDAGLRNGAFIKMIVAEGQGQSNRDVPLGLTAEQSAPIFAVVVSELKKLKVD